MFSSEIQYMQAFIIIAAWHCEPNSHLAVLYWIVLPFSQICWVYLLRKGTKLWPFFLFVFFILFRTALLCRQQIIWQRKMWRLGNLMIIDIFNKRWLDDFLSIQHLHGLFLLTAISKRKLNILTAACLCQQQLYRLWIGIYLFGSSSTRLIVTEFFTSRAEQPHDSSLFSDIS